MSKLFVSGLLYSSLTSGSDYGEQVWIWVNEDGDNFYFDVGEIVRFRIESEEWHDHVPNVPDGDGAAPDRRPPYSLVVCPSLLRSVAVIADISQGSMQMAGLGPISWW